MNKVIKDKLKILIESRVGEFLVAARHLANKSRFEVSQQLGYENEKLVELYELGNVPACEFMSLIALYDVAPPSVFDFLHDLQLEIEKIKVDDSSD